MASLFFWVLKWIKMNAKKLLEFGKFHLINGKKRKVVRWHGFVPNLEGKRRWLVTGKRFGFLCGRVLIVIGIKKMAIKRKKNFGKKKCQKLEIETAMTRKNICLANSKKIENQEICFCLKKIRKWQKCQKRYFCQDFVFKFKKSCFFLLQQQNSLKTL